MDAGFFLGLKNHGEVTASVTIGEVTTSVTITSFFLLGGGALPWNMQKQKMKAKGSRNSTNHCFSRAKHGQNYQLINMLSKVVEPLLKGALFWLINGGAPNYFTTWKSRWRAGLWLAARHLLSALTVGFVIQAPIPKYFSWKFPTDPNAGNYQKPKRKTQFRLESKNGVMFTRMFLKGASFQKPETNSLWLYGLGLILEILYILATCISSCGIRTKA